MDNTHPTHPLLVPRWKVKSLWPACETLGFKQVGDILTDNGRDAVLNQDGVPVIPIKWQEFPALFEPLPWYAERKPEELTGYIKRFYVNRWRVYNMDIGDDALMKWKFGSYNKKNFFPATKEEFEEYTTYLQSQTK